MPSKKTKLKHGASQSEFDASFTRSKSHLAAQLIQSVLGKASGSKRLFELGDNNRGIMVANARAMGLFDHVNPEPLCNTDNLQTRWEAWIRFERSKRLAWCIYVSFSLSIPGIAADLRRSARSLMHPLPTTAIVAHTCPWSR